MNKEQERLNKAHEEFRKQTKGITVEDVRRIYSEHKKEEREKKKMLETCDRVESLMMDSIDFIIATLKKIELQIDADDYYPEVEYLENIKCSFMARMFIRMSEEDNK